MYAEAGAALTDGRPARAIKPEVPCALRWVDRGHGTLRGPAQGMARLKRAQQILGQRDLTGERGTRSSPPSAAVCLLLLWRHCSIAACNHDGMMIA
jgi:hypothetical protein